MVILVTPLVKPVNPPSTPDEKDDTLFTTEAAKVDPGMEGIEMPFPTDGELDGIPMVDVEVPVEGLAQVGS